MTESRDDSSSATPPEGVEVEIDFSDVGQEPAPERSPEDRLDTIPAPPFDPLVGTLLDGRYLLHDSLGEGGMGAVYRATHVLMQKPVAVKLIHSQLAHIEDITKRFEREALSSSRLSDPHCITVTDFGRTEDGTLFLVMELLDGDPLDARLEQDGRLPVAEALRITAQILKGLMHAHEQGVVHRDLKPENIYLVNFGDEADFVKILDFGIAKLAAGGGEGENLTKSGVVFGTPKYLSPEQALGDEVDHRADLYAVGIILFEMLVGEPPFAAETAMDTLSMHLTADPPLLSERGDFPRGLQEIVDKAMAKRPADRFSSAAEFLEAIESLDPAGPPPTGSQRLRGRPTARVPEPPKKAPKKGGSSKVAVVLLILLLLAIGGAAGLYYMGFIGHETVSDKVRDIGPKTRPIKEMIDVAEGQIRDGKAAEAVITAKEVLDLSPDLAPARLILGHALFLSGDRVAAMDEYEKALDGQADLASDIRLKEHLKQALEWQNVRDKGALLMARFGKEEGADFLSGLSNSALTEGEVRRCARTALVEAGKESKIDWLSSLTADFHELKKCKQRKDIIAQMADTRNPDFMPLLETYRPVTTGKKGRKKTSNSCIGADVLRAIEILTAVKEGRPVDEIETRQDTAERATDDPADQEAGE